MKMYAIDREEGQCVDLLGPENLGRHFSGDQGLGLREGNGDVNTLQVPPHHRAGRN